MVRGWLGVRAESLSPVQARFLGITGGGIILNEVHPGTPAADAGLREGDIITAINDEPVVQLKDALHRVARTAPGTRIELSGVSRDREPFDTIATIIERPTPQPRSFRGG